MVRKIDENFLRFARIARRDLKIDVLKIRGGGAAGGAGAGAVAFLGAELRPGIDLVLKAVDFEKKIKGASLILTGEGRIDRQTLQGKTISGVARKAAAQKIPVLAFCGETGPGHEGVRRLGVSKVVALRTPGMNRGESMKKAGPLLKKRVADTLILV